MCVCAAVVTEDPRSYEGSISECACACVCASARDSEDSILLWLFPTACYLFGGKGTATGGAVFAFSERRRIHTGRDPLPQLPTPH